MMRYVGEGESIDGDICQQPYKSRCSSVVNDAMAGIHIHES